MSDPDNRLAEAVNDLEQFRRRWNELGRPEFTDGSKGQMVPHPLIKIIRDTEAAVRMMAPAGQERAGRPQGSQSSPDRRRARLAVVNLASAREKAKKGGSGKS